MELNEELSRTNRSIDLTKTRKKFSEDEDRKLKELVNRYGTRKWDIIAQHMPDRTGRQCRDRYRNYLIPGFFNGQWTAEEDKLLLIKHKEVGHQWAKMAPYFPGRSANALKNRWNYFVCRFPEAQDEKTPQPKSIDPDVIGIDNSAFESPDFMSEQYEFSWNLFEQEFSIENDFFIM